MLKLHLFSFLFLFLLDMKLQSAMLKEVHVDAKYESMDHNPNSEKCKVFLASCIFKHKMMEFQLQEFYGEMCQAQFFYYSHQIHELLFPES